MPGQVRANPLVSETSAAVTNYSPSLPLLDSPIDLATGSPVDPLDLPRYLQTNEWTRPMCLCSVQGFERTTVLTFGGSGSPRAASLVCPEAECPYIGAPTFILC